MNEPLELGIELHDHATHVILSHGRTPTIHGRVFLNEPPDLADHALIQEQVGQGIATPGSCSVSFRGSGSLRRPTAIGSKRCAATQGAAMNYPTARLDSCNRS